MLRLHEHVSQGVTLSFAELVSDLAGVPFDASVAQTSAALFLRDQQISQVLSHVLAPAGCSVLHEAQSFSGCSGVLSHADIAFEATQHTTATSAHIGFRAQTPACSIETRLRFQNRSQALELKAKKHLIPSPAGRLQTKAITRAHVDRYVALVPDTNPIHTDHEVAVSCGFDGCVVPGILLCALAEATALHVLKRKTVSQVKARFLAPALVGDAVICVVTSQPEPQARARVFVVDGDDRLLAAIDLGS